MRAPDRRREDTQGPPEDAAQGAPGAAAAAGAPAPAGERAVVEEEPPRPAAEAPAGEDSGGAGGAATERAAAAHAPLPPGRHAWMALGERVFQHPRYAAFIVAALALAAVTRSRPVLAALGVFFTAEIAARAWVLRARRRACGRSAGAEAWFLGLDVLATASLFLSVFAPVSWAAGGMWLRAARLVRGMYMLRMLRVFRFLSLDAMVYSMGVGVAALAMASLGVLAPSLAPYLGVALLTETGFRAFAALRVVESPARRRAELAFAALDALATVPLLGLVDGLAPAWAGLRAARFLVMLNPLGSLTGALRRVAARDAVRKEATMLSGMFVLLMAATAAAVAWIYPRMDLNGDGTVGGSDYAPWQVLFYGFRILLDPGNAPADAFSPGLALLTMVVVLAGVFFFALFVGLGSNVMRYLLEELANSPLSPRVSLLFAGDNEQAVPVLRAFDAMCARMRRSFASVWLFVGPAREGARALGRWLAVREIEPGSRGVLARFRLSGIRAAVLFQRAWTREDAPREMAELHALARELRRDGRAPGLVVCDSAPPAHARAVFEEALGMEVVDSAGVKARMLYQMHHCAHMPELGMRMMDAVNGETGLYARPWPARIEPAGATSRIVHEAGAAELGAWLSRCFAAGLNLVAARTSEGRHVLFGDLRKLRAPVAITHVLGLGREPQDWPARMREALAEDAAEPDEAPPLAAFTWPDEWDLKLIFVGWHDGLPAMVEEMARKHRRLAVHLLAPGDEEVVAGRRARLEEAAARVAEASPQCRLEVRTHAWDGLDAAALLPLLKGCKVVMLYPPETGRGDEDATLELWFHEIARLLDARKAQVKWWTPPKLMVLPRAAASVPALRRAARDYARLEVHVGSPDAFHDAFVARQVLARLARDRQTRAHEAHAFAFMHVLLGDEVIVEGADAARLLVRDDAGWEAIHREAWRRGWMLVAAVMPAAEEPAHPVMRLLERLFPDGAPDAGGRVRVLAGVPAHELPPPSRVAQLLFCRRGVLETHRRPEADEAGAKVPAGAADREGEAVAEPAAGARDAARAVSPPDSGTEVARKPESEPAQTAPERGEPPAEAARAGEALPARRDEVKEGVPMPESPWPEVADARLLRVLRRQVAEALELLGRSAEAGLVKLAEAMDRDASGAVSEDIMAALTELQNIDRVMQRLRNVETCLADWAEAAPVPEGEPRWREAVEGRYVMEEERQALRSEL